MCLFWSPCSPNQMAAEGASFQTPALSLDWDRKLTWVEGVFELKAQEVVSHACINCSSNSGMRRSEQGC